jgi:hypothetical protein
MFERLFAILRADCIPDVDSDSSGHENAMRSADRWPQGVPAWTPAPVNGVPMSSAPDYVLRTFTDKQLRGQKQASPLYGLF